jgi:hypothetical protein
MSEEVLGIPVDYFSLFANPPRREGGFDEAHLAADQVGLDIDTAGAGLLEEGALGGEIQAVQREHNSARQQGRRQDDERQPPEHRRREGARGDSREVRHEACFCGRAVRRTQQRPSMKDSEL